MVLIFKIGAHVKSNLCYLICLRHLIRSRAVTNPVFHAKCGILESNGREGWWGVEGIKTSPPHVLIVLIGYFIL